MKKIVFRFSLLFAIFLNFSCNDEFLERYPLDQISMQTFWKTEQDLINYNNGLYHLAENDDNVPIMKGHFGDRDWGSYWFYDLLSDNLVPNPGRVAWFNDIRAGTYQVTSQPRYFGYKGWNFVRAINIGLANYYNDNITNTVSDKYTAEARLFRGWFYSDKVSKFGDVPWFEEELNTDSDELYASRTPREDVMTKVLEDLNFAINFLPDDWGDGEPGRLDRWAALAVKARVCLFEGTWRKYHGGSNPEMWLKEAVNAAYEIIENGPFSLYNTGNPLYDYCKYHQEYSDLTGNPEIIYWRKYESGINPQGHPDRFKYYGSTKSMIEEYLCIDGLPISLSPLYQGDEVYEKIFENRDPRLRQSILHPDDQVYYNWYYGAVEISHPRLIGMGGETENATGYHIVKQFNNDAVTAKTEAIQPAIVLRLGEVLLNYAEAKAELGTISQSDLDISINKLRDRVAMPHMILNNIPIDPRFENDGVSPLIVEIRRERRVELFIEGFRYDDLRRWRQGKKLENKVLGMRWDDAAKERFHRSMVQSSIDPFTGIPYIDVHKGTSWENPVFDESKHYLWPIPLNVLAENPNVGQNPGW